MLFLLLLLFTMVRVPCYNIILFYYLSITIYLLLTMHIYPIYFITITKLDLLFFFYFPVFGKEGIIICALVIYVNHNMYSIYIYSFNFNSHVVCCSSDGCVDWKTDVWECNKRFSCLSFHFSFSFQGVRKCCFSLFEGNLFEKSEEE